MREEDPIIDDVNGDPHEALTELHDASEREERDTILVVDDDPDDRLYLRMGLSRTLGRFKIIEARDPEEALAYLRGGVARSIVLICTDGSMPGINGVEFAKLVRGNKVKGNSLPEDQVWPLRRVPIKLITGDPITSEHQAHVASGLLQHVTEKPFSFRDLRENVRSAARRMAG